MVPEPSTDLIRQCQRGDLNAFKLLYRHYEKTIYSYCLRMLNHRQDTEDAVQTIFLKLYTHISGYRYRSRFTTYLFTVARNVCYDKLNQQKVTDEELYHARHVRIDNPQPDRDCDISRAIAQLPQRTRECFILFAVEGLPQNQIAEILEIKTGTVKALIFQARQKLQIWLGE